MKKIVSLFAAIVMTVGIMSAMPLTVNAASKSSSDGLDVSMETSTNSYALNEDEQNIATEVEINVSVKNTNATDFNDVEVKLELPSGLMLKTGDLVESGISVPSGKTHKFTATAIHFKPSSGGNDDNKPTNEDDNPTNSDDSNEKANTNDTSNDIDSPKTGDSFSLASVLVVMLFSASFILVAIRRGMRIPKGVISLGLCLAIVAGAANITVFAAESSTDVKTITVDQTVNISVKNGEESFVIKATISYTKPDTQPAIPLNGEDHLYSPNVENVATDEETGIMYMNNMIIVVFTDTATQQEIDDVIASINGEVVGKIDIVNQYQVKIPVHNLKGLKIMIAQLEEKDCVFFAHYDAVYEDMEASVGVNDPFNGDVNDADWTDNDVDGSNWWLEAIDAPGAWEYDYLFSKAKIGIIDDGFDDSHPDLIIDNYINKAAPGKDTSYYYGDAQDHGTHVTGIIGATTNNIGISGIVHNKELICFDYTDPSDDSNRYFSYTSGFVAGICSTVGSGAKVINNSYGRNAPKTATKEEKDTAAKVYSQYLAILLKKKGDFIIVQSAGNNNVDASNGLFYRAITSDNCFDPQSISNWNSIHGNNTVTKQGILDRILVVGAVKKKSEPNNGKYYKSDFSNFGKQVNICAPGGSGGRDGHRYGDSNYDIYSTVLSSNHTGYDSYPGTSMAAPMVTAVASLVWSVNPSFSGAQVADIVKSSSNYSVDFKSGPFKDNKPMLNARLAVEEAVRRTYGGLQGTLNGRICRASDRTTAIPGATIEVYKDDSLIRTATSNDQGNYSIKVPAGDYLVKITADGYIDFKSFASVGEYEVIYMETFLMVQGSESDKGIGKGRVVNSLAGTGVEGVTLTFKPYWNNTAGTGDTVGTAVTDENGYYTAELPLGNYTALATKSGFLESTFNIVVQEGTTDNQNGTITPIVSGDDYLITLTWGENPNDLDSHVVGTLSSGGQFHVYYSDKSQYDGDTEVCNLDYDDTTSYGPEHITLKPTSDKPYYYYIHHYAGSGSISTSNAKIKVEKGGVLIRQFNVPTALGTDIYWNVFAIVNGEIVVKNTITPEPDIVYANNRNVSLRTLLASPNDITATEPKDDTEKDEPISDSQDKTSSTESSTPVATESEASSETESTVSSNEETVSSEDATVSSEVATVSSDEVASATEDAQKEESPVSSSEDTASAAPKVQNQAAAVPSQKEEADEVSPSDANN